MASAREQRDLHSILKTVWLGHQEAVSKELPKDFSLIGKNFEWLFAQAKRRVLGSKQCPIQTVQEAMKVLENMDEYQMLQGRGITPYEFLKGKEAQSIADEPQIASIVSQVLCYCWADPSISTGDLGRVLPLKKLLTGGNEAMNQAGCQAYNLVFQKLITQLQTDPSINPELATIAIENMLALIPYFEPEEGQVFCVPMFMEGSWRAVDYTVERIRVSSEDYPFTPYYAYGLLPSKGQPQASAQLLFMGTLILQLQEAFLPF
jgi:hypothetical protein